MPVWFTRAAIAMPLMGALGILFFAPCKAAGNDDEQVVRTASADIQAGSVEAARALLRDRVKRNSANPELWNLLGIADAELHFLDEAQQAFGEGLKIKPDSATLNENFGLLFYRQADYANTKKYLKRAVELGSHKPAVLFSLAAAELRTGERAEALSTLKQLEPAMRDVAGYWEERGRAELGQDPTQAEASFKRALQLQPNSLPAINGAAAAAERQGLDERALTYLIRARTTAPDDIETLAHFAAVCIRRDLGRDAIEALERAHKLDPTNTSVLFLLARANVTVQNWERAYELFADFSRRVPNYAPAVYAMGWIDMRLNRTDDARTQLQRALALEPALVDARYDLAELELKEGRIDESRKLLEEVLAKDPNHANANTALADILLRSGDLDGAQAHLERAVGQNATLAAAHYKLSLVLFRKHERERAERERTIAAKLEADQKLASRTELKLMLPQTE